MKKSALFQIVAAILVNCILAVTADSQTYHFTAPISGFSGIALSFGSGGGGGSSMTFGTLDETLFYDPVANTLRQVGTVSIDESHFSFGINDGGFYGGSYGNADLTVTGGGTIAFDTGTLGHSGPSSWLWDLKIPVTGTVSFHYYGYQASLANPVIVDNAPISYSYALRLTTGILAATPESLTVSEQQFLGALKGSGVFGFPDILFDGAGDNTYHYAWQLPATTATVVPESSSLAILGCGLLGFLSRRRFHL